MGGRIVRITTQHLRAPVIFTRLVRLAVVVAASFALLVGGSTAASASTTGPVPADRPVTFGAVTVNCGIVTCSAYLSRSATKDVAEVARTLGAPGVPGVMGMCARAASYLAEVPPLAAGAFAGCAAHGTWASKMLVKAADEHGPRGACGKVTFIRTSGFITYWSTNNGEHCKN